MYVEASNKNTRNGRASRGDLLPNTPKRDAEGPKSPFSSKNGKTFFNFFSSRYIMPESLLQHIVEIILPVFRPCNAFYHARSAEKQFFNDSEKTTHPFCGVLVAGNFAA